MSKTSFSSISFTRRNSPDPPNPRSCAGELPEIPVDPLELFVGPQKTNDQEGLLLLAPPLQIRFHLYPRWPFIIRL